MRTFDLWFRRLQQEILLGGQQVFIQWVESKWQPRVDICETPDALIIKAELPGFSPESLADRVKVVLSPDHRYLTISGYREEAEEERQNRIRCYQLEINYGPFERIIELPPNFECNADHLSARYREGFLIVILPKKPPQSPQVIPIE